jgi:trans-2,3-dihydro-3-hydroxyanthranilate isomerase
VLHPENSNSEAALDYFVLDVFSDARLVGNQLAVVLNPGNLSTELMQAIARETNLSETTFVERRDPAIERREGVLVRIFTTEEELPFAGHPTLGTASLLAAIAPECVVENTVKLALPVGTVPVVLEPRASGASTWPVRGVMTQRDPEFGEILEPKEVAALTGLQVEDFDPALPIQIVSTGTGFAIVPLARHRSMDAIARVQVRQREASTFLRARGARWFYILGPEDAVTRSTRTANSESLASSTPEWRARMQFNGGEDPATGSAAGCAISHLVHYGAVASEQTVHFIQGVEIGRPSHLFVSARIACKADVAYHNYTFSKVTQVRVGGSTILVAKGQLFLP